MEKLKKVRTTDQSFANHSVPLRFSPFHYNRKIWDLQGFVNYAGQIATPERLRTVSASIASWI